MFVLILALMYFFIFFPFLLCVLSPSLLKKAELLPLPFVCQSHLFFSSFFVFSFCFLTQWEKLYMFVAIRFDVSRLRKLLSFRMSFLRSVNPKMFHCSRLNSTFQYYGSMI